MSPRPNVLVLDNRDSFTFNLADAFGALGCETVVVRSGITLDQWQRRVASMQPRLVVLSPGPGRPEDSGMLVPWLVGRPDLPVLGICLGHQAMVVATGGRVERAPRSVHGRASELQTGSDALFAGLPRPLRVGRYHSLAAATLGDELAVVASARDGDADVVMAVRHRTLPWIGMQFHPESILTPYGDALLERVLAEACALQPAGHPRNDQT